MNDDITFSSDEMLRYTRHIQLEKFGIAGQKKLKSARVCIVGCGGLGAPVSLYLSAAGVGHLTLIDDDDVELSNLQRQISFNETDIGKSKASQSQKKLTALNSAISINIRDERLTRKNSALLLSGSDLVIDCSDNFDTRYVINDYCKSASIPWIYASIFQFSGQCAVFEPSENCYRCLFPTPTEQAIDCNTAGVIGVLPGILGTIQALEALKYLLGFEDRLCNELLLVETLPLGLRKIALKKDSKCPCCFPSTSKENAIKSDRHSSTTTSTDRKSIKECSSNTMHINPDQFDQIANDENSLVIDVRSPDEHQTFNIGGINIPLDQLTTADIDERKTLLFYCHSGMRSDNALAWAKENLNNRLQYSLTGGIVAYLSDNSHNKPHDKPHDKS